MSVRIDEKLVLHVARLAKLEIQKDEIPKYQSKLQTIVDYMDDLSECDLSGLDASNKSQEVSLGQVMGNEGISASLMPKNSTPERIDAVLDLDSSAAMGICAVDIQKFVDESPASAGTSFQVPKIIE